MLLGAYTLISPPLPGVSVGNAAVKLAVPNKECVLHSNRQPPEKWVLVGGGHLLTHEYTVVVFSFQA